MSPLPKLHHHDTFFIIIRTVRYNTSLHCSRQQCLVAEWSGRSVTVRVKARARARARSFFYVKRTLSWHGVITPQ